MIEIQHLCKSYGKTPVLKNLNCHVDRNVPTALLGPSGAGKSTLLRCINGLIPADAGTITVDGRVLPRRENELRDFRKNIGIIFQQFNLIKRMSVLDNVLTGRLGYMNFWRSMLKQFSSEDYEKAGYYLDKVGLYDKRFHRASELSGGQQQRVAIARALIQSPKVLLADEPVASLDPITSRDIMALLVKISQEEQITLVVTLHSIELALAYSEKIIGLNHGHIILNTDTKDTCRDKLYALYGPEKEADHGN